VSRRFDDLDAVLEFDAGDDLWQLVFTLQAPPCFRGGVDEFKDHELGGLRRQGSLRPDGSMTHVGEHALDWVGRAEVVPVLGREVEEASRASRSLVRQATAFSYLAPYGNARFAGRKHCRRACPCRTAIHATAANRCRRVESPRPVGLHENASAVAGLLVMPIAVTAKDLETTHLFGFTLGTDVNDVGDIEGELETTGRFACSGSRSRRTAMICSSVNLSRCFVHTLDPVVAGGCTIPSPRLGETIMIAGAVIITLGLRPWDGTEIYFGSSRTRVGKLRG
jgi:hypothetical protein